jgi:hypothetical protein
LAGLEGLTGAEPDEGFWVIGVGLENLGGSGEAASEGGFVAGEPGEDVVADLEVEAGGGVLEWARGVVQTPRKKEKVAAKSRSWRFMRSVWRFEAVLRCNSG